MGFVKHAFILAIYCLLRAADMPIEVFYDWSMRQVTKLQGDTDTNCAIVGGITGAYVGVHNIDEQKIRKLLQCKLEAVRKYICDSGDRPKFILPGEGCIDEMLELVRISPSRLEIVKRYVA